MAMTTQKQIRAAFWQDHPQLDRKKISDGAGGRMHVADTRVAFVDYVDHLNKNGEISDALAQRATLEG